MGGSSGNQTTTSRVELPAYEDAARQELFNSARWLYTNHAPQYFPRTTVAQMSPYSQGAIDELATIGVSPYQTAINQSSIGTMENLDRARSNPLQSGLGTGIASRVENSALAPVNTLGDAQSGLNTLRQNTPGGVIVPQVSDINAIREDANSLRGLASQGVILGNLEVDSGRGLLDVRGADFLNSANSSIQNNVGDTNPYIQEAIRTAIQGNNRNFTDTVLPSMRLGQTAANATNNTRSEIAEGLAASRLGEANARIAAELSLAGYESARDRELQAGGLAGQLASTAENQAQSRLASDRGYGLSRAGLQAQVDGSNIDRSIGGISSAAGLQSGAVSGSIAAGDSQTANTLAGLNFGANVGNQNAAVELARANLGLSGAKTDADIRATGEGLSLDSSRIQAGFLPIAQQMPLLGTEALLQAGRIDEAYRQQLIDDERARFDFYQGVPENKLNNYAALLSGNSARPYTTSTAAPGTGTSTAAGALGGAATGAGLASSLGLIGASNAWNPAGWAAILAGAGLGAYSASQG